MVLFAWEGLAVALGDGVCGVRSGYWATELGTGKMTFGWRIREDPYLPYSE